MADPSRDDVVSQTIATYNKIAPAYCGKTRIQKYLDWEGKYIQKMISLIDIPDPLILDVGCGDGRHCRLIDEDGARSIGVDLSSSMIAESVAYYPQGKFVMMDMRHLSFGDSRFDGIWSSGSFYHVRKAEAGHVAGEFGRILKSGGVLAINFKLGSAEGLEANPKSYGGSPRYFAYYSRDEMVKLLGKYGFREIEACLYPEEIYGDNLQQMWLRLEM